MKKSIRLLFALAAFCTLGYAQAPPYALLPVVRSCFYDANGNPLSGGLVHTYAAGTSTPLATYTDSSGAIQNANPVQLDSAGCAGIWLGPSLYKISVANNLDAQLYLTDNVSDVGQILYTQSVLLNPVGASLQTILGPLSANYFTGITPHTTSPNVRVSLLDQNTILDTPLHPPTINTIDPDTDNRIYQIPDVHGNGNFVINKNANGLNQLDCTNGGVNCTRTAYAYFEGASCNAGVSAIGWDTFATNSPVPLCGGGVNVQKGLMSLPGAATLVQENVNGCAASGTCNVPYPAATVAGDLLEVEIAVDGSKTVSSVTDGTNAYSKAVSIVNGTLDLEIWYFNGNSTSKAASTTLTVTLSGAANVTMDWKEYAGILTSGMLDKTATNTGTGTAATTGTTTGTSQNVELLLGTIGMLGARTLVFQNGWTGHNGTFQGTNISINSEGQIQQTIGFQQAAFTISTSATWASAIATFKVNVAGPVTAQRSIVLPSYYLASAPVSANIKWQAPSGETPTGTVNVSLGAQLVCTADGGTDDPAFLTATTATTAVNTTTASTIMNTPLTPLTQTGCGPGNIMHFQILRNRYSAADTYESYVYVNGALLNFGISQ